MPYDQDRELPPPEPGSMIYEGGPDGPIIPGQTPENPGGGETPPEIPEIPGVDGTTPVEGEVPEIPDVVDPDEAESETAKAERQQLEEHELLEMLDLPERTAGELYATRKVYAEMMARRRSGKFNASELEDARKAYVQACNEATAFVLGHLQGKGITDKERLRDLSRLGAEQEIIKTAQLTREFEGEQKEKVGKLRGKLYDFWERNDTGYVGRDRTGLSRWGRFKASVADMAGSFKHSMSTAENIKKTLKKTALMAAMGTAIGFPLGAAGVALLGPGLAAGLSAAAAKGISRGGVAGGLSRGANANSLAQASYDRTIGSMNQMFQDEFMADTGPNGIYGGTKIAEVSRAETKKVVSANRRRIGKAATVGAIFGSAGAFAGDALLGGGGGGGNTPEQPTGGGNGPTPETPGAGGATPETPDGGDGIPEVSVPDPNDITEGQFNTPWSWAAEQYGENNAMARLHELSDRAAAAGHQVEWHNVADGNGTNDWVEIDGVSNTADVVNILNNFQQ